MSIDHARGFDEFTAEEQEDRAQSVLVCLARGSMTVRELGDALVLTPSAMRVTLDRLEDRGRVVRWQTFGDAVPRWLATEAPA